MTPCLYAACWRRFCERGLLYPYSQGNMTMSLQHVQQKEDRKRTSMTLGVVGSRIFAVISLLLLETIVQAAENSFQQSLLDIFHDYQPPSGPTPVRIGLVVEEITEIDQRQENFSLVATLQIRWRDPKLAFQPESGGEPFRVYRGEAFEDFVSDRQLRWPRFSFFNQQGNRFTQNKLVLITADGRAFYLERFTAKLQAPHLHFSKFPFDSQDFFIDIDLLAPTSFYRFTEQQGDSRLGDLLGLEEWNVTRFDTRIFNTQQGVGYESSRFRYQLHAKRKAEYYKLRIFAPIAMIVFISWVIFFLQDYRKRIDIAGGNLLLLIAFNFVISSDLPRLSYLTFMDSMLFTAFFITSLTVVVNVMLRYIEIHGQVELARRMDYFIIWIYLLLYLVCIGIAYKMFY